MCHEINRLWENAKYCISYARWYQQNKIGHKNITSVFVKKNDAVIKKVATSQYKHTVKTEHYHDANFVVSALHVVVMTACGASSDDKVCIMMTLRF